MLKLNKKLLATATCSVLLLLLAACEASVESPVANVESAIKVAQAAPEQQQDESYQRVYEAFTKLMENVSNNSLGNVRRLVSRLNNLVGGESRPAAEQPASSQAKQTLGGQREQSVDEKTEQVLNKLDNINKNTDQHTLSQINEDVTRLISTLNDSYLRNIRRVVERVNRVVGRPTPAGEPKLHQSGDRLEDPAVRVPGFPGWDELIVAVDRMQKSFAHFVRSSTRLITSG